MIKIKTLLTRAAITEQESSSNPSFIQGSFKKDWQGSVVKFYI